ncbi:NAD(P)-bindingprotein [Moniliophthora roreri MCA 2997]|uniref:NAD(P)-bindingprotein n=2 Tax=Moniliophthora roreri TaxID=221103 RepID=V2XWM2_MONRO|nr:NAD(P)-bindingprotein [Moniliophthora roreri MCA 2997]KAI3610805.1 NAD(P)-bindingprotein [Moniliophthora roreri]
MAAELSDDKVILVTGAIGRQGRAFISATLSSGVQPPFHILALTRTASSHGARELANQHPSHLSLVEGNLDDKETIQKVFEDAKRGGKGIWGVFCVLAFPGLGASADGEERQGKMMADLSLEYGVMHFVFSSVERGGEASDATMMNDRLAKINIEKHVKELGKRGLSWTIIRPGFFMENYEGIIGRITFAILKAGLQSSTTVQLIAVKDIGHIAAGVYTDPIAFQFQILVAVGETSTIPQQEESYKAATGRTVPSIPTALARALIAVNSHTKQLILDMERVHRVRSTPAGAQEYHMQWEAAKRAYPNLMTFGEWARRDGTETRRNDWNGVTLGKMLRGKQ